MLKRLLVLLVFIIGASRLFAQVPPPCEPPGTTSPAENCFSACINCNFNGYMGNTGGFAADNPPPNWCSNIQNDQWLGFIAGAAACTFTLTPMNCTGGNGVQMALYSGCNDDPIDCNAGCQGCGSMPISITGTTIPGVNYYLIIDGYSGDECDFTITVVPNSCVQAPNVGSTGQIAGPATVCPGATVTYSIPTTTGAGFYTWTSNTPGVLFNGQGSGVSFEAPEGRVVEVTFPSDVTMGTVQICVEPSNSCSNGTQRCRNITIQAIPVTTIPKETVCAEDAPYFTPWGLEVTQSGTYEETLTSYLGCDSTVRQQVVIKPPLSSSQTRFICYGECYTICGVDYCDTGLHSEICDSYQGCDSTVTLTLNVLEPIAQIIGGGELTCGQPTIVLNSAPSPNTPGNSTKVWRNVQTGTVTPGNTYTVTAPGTYILTTTMTAGGKICTQSDTITITGNTTPPTAMVTGGVIGCGSATATLGVATNATSPTYSWSGPPGTNFSTSANPVVGQAGTYTVIVTTASNGCTASATAVVSGNTTPPGAAAVGGTLDCNNTSILVTATSPTSGVNYAWSGPNSFTSTAASPSVTNPGNYVVTITNPTNNCTSTATAIVGQNTAQPGASAIVSGPIGCPTPTVTMTANSPASPVTYAWSGPGGFASASATPNVGLAGTYTVMITGANGCTSTASVNVTGNTNLPGAAATNTELSCGITQDTLFGSSPTPGSTFVWTGPGVVPNPNPQIAVVNQTGTYTLTVTGTNGCTSTATAVANGNFATPNASATGGIITCSSNSTTINGSSTTPGATFSWTGPGGFTANGPSATVVATGNYTLIVTGTNGCTSTAQATVNPDANIPNAAAAGDTINCTSSNALITGSSSTAGVTLSWTGPNGFTSSTPTNMVATPGTYTLNVFNPANGCNAQALAVVAFDQDAPGASTLNDTLTCTSPSLQIFGFSPTSGVTWSWSGTGFTSNLQNPMVSGAGDYTLTVTDPTNGCTSTAVSTISANQDIPQLNLATNTLTCTTTSVVINTTSNLPVGFSWTGPGFVSTQQNPSVTEPGVYVVTATAANGCSSTANITVNQDIAAPNAGAAGDTITCAQPIATLSATSSTAGATFAWTGPAGFTPSNAPNPTTNIEGAYSLVVTGTNGCQSTVSANVELNTEEPIIQIAQPGVLTCVNLDELLQTTILTSLSSVSQIDWNGPAGFDSNVEDPTVVNPGTYSVVVTSLNGCSETLSVQVDQDIAPPNAAATGGTLTCALTVISLDGGSSTPGATFDWTGPGLNAVVEDPSVSQNGTFTLTVTGPNGCETVVTALVNIDTIAPGAAIASSNILTCTDQTATLSSQTTAGNEFFWSGCNISGETTATISVDEPCVYTLLVTNSANGCTSSTTFDQTNDITPPDAQAVGDTLDCISGVATLSGSSATNGSSFGWQGPGGVNQNGATISVTNAGVYTLTVTGPNGCESTTTAEIIENIDAPQIEIDGSGILTCDNLFVTFTASILTPNTVGEWTLADGSTATTASIDAAEPGTYTFQAVSTVNGCANFETVNLGQNITPPANVLAVVSGPLDCTHPTVTIIGETSTSGAVYTWSGPGGFTSDLSETEVGTAGLYTLTVENPVNGCTATATVDVDSNPDIPTVTASANIITCAEPVVTLDANSTTAGVTYEWSGPNFQSNEEDPTTGAAGVYIVTVTDPSNGCTSEFSLTVQENTTSPDITAIGDTITCTEPTVTLQGGSNTAGATFAWFNAQGNQISTQPTPSISEPGQYTLVVTDPVNGCTSELSAEIVPDENIPVATAVGGTITCTVIQIQLAGDANKPDITWEWTGPGGFTSDQQNPTVTEPGQYTLVVSTPNGCSGQATAVVLDDTDAPQVNIDTPEELDCNTTQITLSANTPVAGDYTFSWTTVDGNIDSGELSSTPTVTAAAIYTVLVTDNSNGCTTTADIEVQVDPAVPSAVALTARDVSCYGYTNGSVAIGDVSGGTPPFVYSLDGQPFVAATAFNALDPGEHTLLVQDANGCELLTSFDINEPAELLVDLGADTTIHLGDPLTLSIDNSVNFPERVVSLDLEPAWLDTVLCPTCTSTFEPAYSFDYEVTVIDSNDCRASDVRRIIVDRTRRIFVPNVFNPNGDGTINSFLPVFGGTDVRIIRSFKIYDRWGESVHQAFDFLPNDIDSAWDGKIRGKEANPAVFIWVLEVEFKDGEIELFTGDVAITR